MKEKYSKVYEVCRSILYKHGHRMTKKHGNWIVLYGKKNQVVYMDSWNGAITQAHCASDVMSNGFCLESTAPISNHTHINKPEHQREFNARTLEEAVDVYKTLMWAI